MNFKLQISIRWKLLSAFVGMILVVVLVMLYSIGSIVEDRIREDISTNFAEAGLVFERIQEIRFRQLRQSGILTSEIPQLKAAISTGDSTTVTQLLRNDLQYLLDFDPLIPDSLITDSAGLLVVCDKNGLPIGQLSENPLPHFPITDRPGISEALQGIYPERAYIWESDSRYFNVITVPVFLQDRLYGTLSYGFPMRQLETEQLSRDMGMDITYFVDNQIIASSFTNEKNTQRKELTKLIHNTTYDVLAANEAKNLDIRIDNEDWLMYVAPMQANTGSHREIPGYFMVAKSLTLELQTLRNIQSIIFILGLCGILGAAFISFWITGRITKPISMLVEGVKRIEKEDFSRNVPITTNDELGTLTFAFNNLAQAIQERLLMLKFVSKATLDAIKKNLSQVDPGGELRDVVVLFSDIRGFTSWSEKRSPQEVIDMLNELFSFQAEAIQRFGGDIDKFVGDELVAVFQGKDKEQQAVEASIYIQKSVKKFVKYPDEIAVGIGINSGDVVMGAMGSSDRMDYTVLGHNVNLGARLCSSANRGQILISDQVFLRLERRIATNTLKSNTIRMKGFEQPIRVHEVDWAEIQEYVI